MVIEGRELAQANRDGGGVLALRSRVRDLAVSLDVQIGAAGGEARTCVTIRTMSAMRRDVLAAAGGAAGSFILAACGGRTESGLGLADTGPPVKLTYLHEWKQTQGHGPITDQLAARLRAQTPSIQVEPVLADKYYEKLAAWQQWVKEEPRIKPFVEMLAIGRATPKLSAWEEIVNLPAQARDDAATQKKTPQEALDDVARAAEPLIKQG